MDHYLFASKIKNLTLLYIEDDVEIQAYLSEFLERYTSNLYLAQNAEKGKELYEEIHPDIILLDINLPGKNGIEFARELRKHDHTTRIIISTAYTDKAFLLTAVELELTRYLVKPVTSIELMEALSKAADEYITSNQSSEIHLGEGFLYNHERKVLLHNNEVVTLRRKEMQLLEFFIAHTGNTLSYEALQHKVWSDSVMSKDAVRAQIRNLRKKSHHGIIENISAIGYRLYTKEKR
ncbi:MAG: response regulator transcription factor [Campylobacterota bacterium]|nr:response regulator transcription factor [Campylobacterota bacterium]